MEILRIDTGGEPTITAAPAPGDGIADLGREREIRRLRASLADAERKLAEATATLKPSAILSRDGPHSIITCGFHDSVIVSDDTDRVECAVCREPLSAIEVLRRFAREEMNFVFSLHELQKERLSLRAEVDALRKKKQTLQSDIRKREGKRKCRRCATVYERAAERCPACKMPATGPAEIRVPR